MNLIFRLLVALVSTLFKPRLPAHKPSTALSLMVLPNDIDINFHMNNGRYFTICDLARIDIFLRTGLAKTMLKEKWIPVISTNSMIYKKPLRVFQRYRLEMDVLNWDERSFDMTHRFIVEDRIVAKGSSKGIIVGKEGVIPPKLVLAKVDAYSQGDE
jgi:acyl-CoA thioesterase FadM